MRPQRRSDLVFFLLLAMAGIVVGQCAGCTGIKARQEILLPALVAAWPSVRAEAVLGDATIEPTATSADAAFESQDKAQIALVKWSLIQAAATAGIAAKVQSGTVSAGVAESLRERDRQFFGGIQTYLQR